MLSYSKLSKKPKMFRTFTGLEVREFNDLYPKIEEKYPEYESRRLGRKDRKKAIGQGGKFKLELVDRLLMLLVYYRLYTTFCLTGFLFDLDQSNVYRDIKYIEPLVKACVPIPQKVHMKARRIGDPDELVKYFPELKAFVDATEQEIPRPKNKRRRRSHYSGKKKRHTVKTQVMVNKRGLIIHKTRHVRGRKHDYDLYKANHPVVPPGVERVFDLGYQGVEKDFPSLKTRIPVKKPKGGELTGEEKRRNKRLRRERVVVEHTIGKVKKFNILGSEFRNRLSRYDNVVSVVSGLVNFRVLRQEGFGLT